MQSGKFSLQKGKTQTANGYVLSDTCIYMVLAHATTNGPFANGAVCLHMAWALYSVRDL